VAFEGEVRDKYSLPLLWRFDKDDEDLLQLSHLPAKLLTQAALFYRTGNWDERFHNQAIPPPPEWLGETVTTLRGLISIPVGWAPLFLDYPAVGAAFRRLNHLIVGTDTAGRRLLQPFSDGLAFA
jgi:hypothetical protein